MLTLERALSAAVVIAQLLFQLHPLASADFRPIVMVCSSAYSIVELDQYEHHWRSRTVRDIKSECPPLTASGGLLL